MSTFIIVGLLGTFLVAFVAARLARWGITKPVALIGLGVVSGVFFGQDLGSHLDTGVAERVVEVILAVLLFTDATEVRGRIFGERARLSARLILLALPLSVVLAVLVGLALFPQFSLATALVLACVVMPTDLATASSVLTDKRIPARLRHALNIESGYNDAIVSPLFLIALASAVGAQAKDPNPLVVLEDAVLPFLLAVLVGGVIGSLAGFLALLTLKRGYTTVSAARIGVAALPILAYAVAVSVQGNGFVAAFVAGIAYRILRTRAEPRGQGISHAELATVDDLGSFASSAIWYVLGGVLVLAFETGVDWPVLAYAALALTLLRMLPVALSLLGSGTSWKDRFVLGLMGPRGPASIVFGLLAYNALIDDDADILLYTVTVAVIGSAVFHGMFASSVSSAVLEPRRRPRSRI
ncbi:cation:proton antiporter [Plantibacter sp. YIM 135347]|uniref:cation:proton antiporter n=1 Tax=Plantibacter sp. YIM 135347 TaxID=3423919 RepID=UPI003D349CD2